MRSMVRLGIVLAAVMCQIGCTTNGQSAGQTVASQSGIGAVRMLPAEIQSELMGFTDSYVSIVAQSVDAVMEGSTVEYRARVHTAGLESITSAITIAAGPNPVVALLDMTAAVTLQRQVIEEFWVPEVWGEKGEPIAEAFRTLEREIWDIAQRVLFDEQIESLRALIAGVRERFPNQRNMTSIRASDIAQARGSVVSANLRRQGSGNILSLFALDPTSGLDPTRQEILQSRLLAERAFFYTKRVPTLMNWQVRNVILRTAAMPETVETIAALKSVATASEDLTVTIDRFVTSLPEERRLAIEQFGEEATAVEEQMIAGLSDALAGEREEIRRILHDDDEEIRGLLGDVRATVDAATAMSESVERATEALNTLVGTDDPATPAAATDARPFDITEYQAAADSLGRSAEELNRLTASLQDLLNSPGWDDRQSGIQDAADRAQAGIEEVVELGYRRGLILVGVLLVGLFIVFASNRLLFGRRATT